MVSDLVRKEDGEVGKTKACVIFDWQEREGVLVPACRGVPFFSSPAQAGRVSRGSFNRCRRLEVGIGSWSMIIAWWENRSVSFSNSADACRSRLPRCRPDTRSSDQLLSSQWGLPIGEPDRVLLLVILHRRRLKWTDRRAIRHGRSRGRATHIEEPPIAVTLLEQFCPEA